MKKYFVLLGIIIILILVTGIMNISAADNSRRPSDYNIGISYDSAVNSNKPAIVLFYADWCGYCKKFMPNFASLYHLFATKYSFSMVNVDSNPVLAKQMRVQRLPSVFIIDKKHNQKFLIPAGYYSNINGFHSYLNNYLKTINE